MIGKKPMEDRNAPATKGDLIDLESRIEESIEILRSEINHQYRELVERISDTQTELLRAFYSFAQTNNKRVLEVEGNEAALRGRVGTLEDRVLEIEKRLNLPPAA
jgi:hypothetical protein